MIDSERTGDLDGNPTTLFGWPRAHDGPPPPGALCVLGVPTDRGNPIARGAAWAPAAIRRASLLFDSIAASGIDMGDVDDDVALDPARAIDRIGTLIAGIRAAGGCPLVIGGDHSITYAPVAALRRSTDLCVIWIDAHTDFSPWSGQEFHDYKQVLRRIDALDGVRRIVQIGYRGITAGDERWLGDKATVVTTAAARALDEEGLLALVPADLPCYLSIDIDAIDPEWAPGTSAPVPDGLTPGEVVDLLTALVRHRVVAGIDLMEVNPRAATGDATARLAAGLLRAVAAAWPDRCTAIRSDLLHQAG